MTNVLLDFNNLDSGDLVADQYAASGVHISSGNGSKPAMIFDSANPTGGDWDLQTRNLEKVLIISEDGDSSDPDDNAGGGTLVFEFDSAATIQSLRLLDCEEGGTVSCYAENGDLIKTVDLPTTDNNGQTNVEIDAEGVYRMEVSIDGSAAIDNICYAIDLEDDCDVDPNGIVEGDDTDNLIDAAYTGDPQGDMIDAGDNIFPGAGADDDIVYAGGGDDIVYGGEGDDEIFGDRAFAEPGQVEITITASSAAFDNKVFAYTLNPETGDISNVVILSHNAKDDIGKTFTYDVGDCGVVGVGIISPEGTFISSAYGENLDLNPDGKLHTQALGEGQDGSVNIGFEDLLCLGDRDFNDVELNIDLGTSGATFDNAHYDYSSEGPGVDDTAVGNDILHGGDGDDTLYGQQGNDFIVGGEGADTSLGGDDADLIGGGRGDVIEGGEGGVDEDSIFVGGLATVEYDPTDPEAGTVTFYDSDLNADGTADFSEIENVYVVGGGRGVGHDGRSGTPGAPESVKGIVEGTHDDDLIDVNYTGDPDGDMVDNDDAVYPLTGEQDIIVAGKGEDTVFAGLDEDLVFGGKGEDILHGEEGNDGLDGGDGEDELYGGAGRDIVFGGKGDDLIDGGRGVDGDGGDILHGGDDRDTFVKVTDGDLVKGGDGGDDCDTLDLTGSGPLRVTDLTPDSDGNGYDGTVEFLDGPNGSVIGTTTFKNIEKIIPCFTPGTRIATPKGERPVEQLTVGDKIITRDNGIQEIRWYGQKKLNHGQLEELPHLQPVLIKAGSLGDGLPERDMIVSPNHRMLVANDRTSLYFEEHEVLVAAKHLVNNLGVQRVKSLSTTYIHFMFDQHEVVLADGSWTESFQPGDYTLKGLGNAQRDEIFQIFPELTTSQGIGNYVAARRTLKRHEALLLTQ